MQIDIAAISLDIENFRHEKVTTEREALRHLLSDEKLHKVAELARDIVKLGELDPSSRLIVTEDEANEGRFIVLEGNRRITALKALMTPALASGTSAFGAFKELHSQFQKLGLSKVECVVMDRKRAREWIKRKHYKGMSGAGVLPWSAIAKARSDASEGKYTPWLTTLAFLEKHKFDAEEILNRISKNVTTIDRVLVSPQMSKILGIGFSNEKIIVENGDEPAAAELLYDMMEKMSEPAFVESIVSNKEQQLSFIEQFQILNVKNKPKISSEEIDGHTSSDRCLDNRQFDAGGEKETSSPIQSQQRRASANEKVSSTPQRSKPSRTRKFLAKNGLRISNDAMNRFYSELRSLDAEKNPHLAFAIIRIFLEKSVTLFLTTMKVPTLDERPDATWFDLHNKLKDKVEQTVYAIDPDRKLVSLKYALDIVKKENGKLHTLDHLNHAIHDHTSLPAHTEIITIWDRYHPFFEEIFNKIESRAVNE